MGLHKEISRNDVDPESTNFYPEDLGLGNHRNKRDENNIKSI